jgi:arabinogalactan oligomer / maltooligosaccharide transport system permease protein
VKNPRFERNDSLPKVILIYAILAVFCFITVYPILNLLSVSLRPGDALFSTSLSIIPEHATLENFKKAFTEFELATWLKNSLFVSIISSVFGVAFSITAGYAFSRFKFRGRRQGLILLLITQMFPATMLLLPLYLMLIKFGLNDSYLGLIIVYTSTAIPFNIWMMKGYYDTISPSLEESAYVDGANVFTSFYKIILPLATPAIALTALFSFMGAWSEYITANVILTSASKATLPIGLVTMQGEFRTAWGIYSAAALITAVPVMALFVSLSKYLVGGLTLGGVKG